jgi:hypothetical protein
MLITYFQIPIVWGERGQRARRVAHQIAMPPIQVMPFHMHAVVALMTNNDDNDNVHFSFLF